MGRMLAASTTILLFLTVVAQLVGQDAQPKPVSFKKDVFPIIDKRCLSCHAEDEDNPSELSMDTYAMLMAGGKHGKPVIPGKSAESILVQKLSAAPPFGNRMPLNKKRRIAEGKAKWLSDEEVKTVADWIDQGAKDN